MNGNSLSKGTSVVGMGRSMIRLFAVVALLVIAFAAITVVDGSD